MLLGSFGIVVSARSAVSSGKISMHHLLAVGTVDDEYCCLRSLVFRDVTLTIFVCSSIRSFASGRCRATYDDLFSAPFEPWSSNANPGSRISGPYGLLELGGESSGNAGPWEGLRGPNDTDDSEACSINLTHMGELWFILLGVSGETTYRFEAHRIEFKL